MGERTFVPLVSKVLFATSPRVPEPGVCEPSQKRLEITVLFTSVRSTVAALRRAGDLASHLDGRITLLVPQVVPYPLPLDSAPVPVEFNERRFRIIAEESRVETTVQVCLCRDRYVALQSVLTPRSLIVIGSLRRWWPTAEKRLIARLRRAGHEVVVTTE